MLTGGSGARMAVVNSVRPLRLAARLVTIVLSRTAVVPDSNYTT